MLIGSFKSKLSQSAQTKSFTYEFKTITISLTYISSGQNIINGRKADMLHAMDGYTV